MKSLWVVFLFVVLSAGALQASDVIQATSEDINEFDQLFGEQPAPVAQPRPAQKEAEKPRSPRQEFYGRKNPNEVRGLEVEGQRPKGPPRHDRERGRKNPPPPPPGAGPPPPPPSGDTNPPPPPID